MQCNADHLFVIGKQVGYVKRILAKEIKADFVIIDDNMAYRIATTSVLNVTRTLSVLLRAKEKGIVREIKPILDEMISKGRWYSKNVYRVFLKKSNEL